MGAIMASPLIIDFTDPAKISYDLDEIDISGGKAKLKDLTPSNVCSWATYASSVDLSGGGGILTGTSVGGAAISGGFLDLTGETLKYVDYTGLGNADCLIQTGAIKFILKPGYSGSPAALRNYVVISEASGDSSNLINLYHKTDGNLKLVMNNLTTGTITQDDLGVWSPIAGSEYEIEINFIIDTVTGAQTFIRVFVEGNQFGPTKTGVTGTRSSAIGLIRIGTNLGIDDTADFSIKDFVIYDTVQHTTNYTPGYTLPTAQFNITNPYGKIIEGFRTDELESFIETASKTGNDEIKYIFENEGDYYYINNGAWTVGSLQYSNSTTASDIQTHLSTLVEKSSIWYVYFFLHSDNGTTTPELSNLQIDYSYAGETPDTINTCVVWGYNLDFKKNSITKSLTIRLNKYIVQYGNYTSILSEDITVTPDNSGYWEVELVESENMISLDGDDVKYIFDFGNANIFEKTVPDEEIKSYYDLED